MAKEEMEKVKTLCEIEELQVQCKTPEYIHVGICSKNNWMPGKKVEKAEYEKEVKAFGAASVSGRNR